ncbi:hypothetical protein ABW20_dc0110415 [Dactylellina cionopaga]|nr:hypothetical protein ABW20_dc0110415 [Dactylellina cionopaga]
MRDEEIGEFAYDYTELDTNVVSNTEVADNEPEYPGEYLSPKHREPISISYDRMEKSSDPIPAVDAVLAPAITSNHYHLVGIEGETLVLKEIGSEDTTAINIKLPTGDMGQEITAAFKSGDRVRVNVEQYAAEEARCASFEIL